MKNIPVLNIYFLKKNIQGSSPPFFFFFFGGEGYKTDIYREVKLVSINIYCCFRMPYNKEEDKYSS